MIATAGTQYEYNATGERVSKDNSSGVPQTLYLHDGDGNQIAELNAALTVQHVNVYSGKHLVGTWNPASGKVYYAYSDWLGTKRYEADGGGTYVNSWASLPFGDNQTALGTGPDATEHHFTGQEHDAESGLDHFAARYYQSQTARWLLPDWSATPVPVPYATSTNPQSLNLYTYVGNNPVNAVDADGHMGPSASGYVGNNYMTHAECGSVSVDGSGEVCPLDDGSVVNAGDEEAQVNNAMVEDKQQGDAKAQQQSVAAQCPGCGDKNSAAVAAEKAALPLTQASVDAKNYHEYGGYILESKSNPDQFTYSKPLAGTERQVDIDNIRAPKGYKVVGEYHTHPRGPGDNLEGFSTRDGNRYNANGRVGYVADNNTRRMYVFVPGVTVNQPDWERTGDFVQKIP